jgi:hypothetical protein
MKKSAYYVLAGDFTWRRSTDLFELINHYSKRHYNYVIYQMVFDDCTDEEVTIMMNCFGVTGLGYIMQCTDIEQSEKDMIEKYFIGWVVTKVEVKEKKTKKAKV